MSRIIIDDATEDKIVWYLKQGVGTHTIAHVLGMDRTEVEKVKKRYDLMCEYFKGPYVFKAKKKHKAHGWLFDHK